MAPGDYCSLGYVMGQNDPFVHLVACKNRNGHARHDCTTSSASIQSTNFPLNKLMYNPYNSVSRFMFTSTNFSFGIQVLLKIR